jgi:hypothetical protein
VSNIISSLFSILFPVLISIESLSLIIFFYPVFIKCVLKFLSCLYVYLNLPVRSGVSLPSFWCLDLRTQQKWHYAGCGPSPLKAWQLLFLFMEASHHEINKAKILSKCWDSRRKKKEPHERVWWIRCVSAVFLLLPVHCNYSGKISCVSYSISQCQMEQIKWLLTLLSVDRKKKCKLPRFEMAC